jgi:hypothetical protein
MRMVLRLGMFLLVSVLLIAVFAHAKTYKAGKDRWTIKTSVMDGALHGTPKTMRFSKFVALANTTAGQLTLAANKEGETGTRFEKTRIRTAGLPSPQEGDMIRTTAFLQLITAENDGDYHIQLSNAYDEREPVMIVEIPRPEFVPDEALKQRVTAARSLLEEKLNGGNEIGKKMCMLHPPKVTVAGQLFFDRTHLSAKRGPGGGRGKDGHEAASLWEIHPVTDTAFVSKKDASLPALKCP